MVNNQLYITRKRLRELNPKREPLTPQKFKELSGRNCSDEEAEEIVRNIRILVSAIVDHQFEEERKRNDLSCP